MGLKIREVHMKNRESWRSKYERRDNFKRPYFSIAFLAVLTTGCLFAEFIMPQDPVYMNLAEINAAPSGAHLFGTDTLGRDIFSMIWYGGRISLSVALIATLISTLIAALYGTASGLAGRRVDEFMMRGTELLMSIPNILLIIFVQAMIGEPTVISIAVVIGITGWMPVAKMVRSEVKQIRNSDYILAARTMGGRFLYLLTRHLSPNFMPAIMFMIVTSVGSAIAAEATLSFLGIGLPTNVISWGSLMSLSQQAILSGSWHLLIIPGAVLVLTIISITDIGEYLRAAGRRERLL